MKIKEIFKNFKKILNCLFILSFVLTSTACGIYRPVDARKVPQTAEEKRRKNIEEGRGVSLKGMIGGNSTTFEFSTSNPLWRASLEVLDFIPLSTVDYAGGIIITDWYADNKNLDESIKISIRFLTNEVRSDSLKIIIYQKKCQPNQTCYTNILNSKIREELISSIIKKAAIFEKDLKKKK
jgi:hypothetical protein